MPVRARATPCEMQRGAGNADNCARARTPAPAFESVLELLVVAGVGRHALRRRGAALEELRSMAAVPRLARLTRGALGRVAADLGLQLDDVEEDVGLAAELVGDHGWLGRDGGHDRHAHP